MNRRKILLSIILFTTIIVILIIILQPKARRYNKIIISADKWDSIINARTENKNLVLEDIEFNDYNLIIDEKNNTLYYSIVNDSNGKYNPNVSFIASNKKTEIAVLSDEITDELVKNNYKFKIIIYNDIEYHIYNMVCKDLPLLNISYEEETWNEKKVIPINLYLFDNLTNIPNKITTSSGKLKINENNYMISLNMITPGNNVRENKKSILNMKPSSEYTLTKVNSEEDKIDEDIEPKNNRVALFMNNEYQGIYSLDHKAERKDKSNK